jgi:hypothetical protein
MTANQTRWFIYGILALLAVKYLFLGLENWNGILHPERQDRPNSAFRYPLLGLGQNIA